MRVGHFFGIMFARDWYGDLDAYVSIAFGLPREFHCLSYFSIRFAWNWLPDRTYLQCSPSPNDSTIDSVRWTGRHLQIIEIGRWRRSFCMTWKRSFIVDRSW